MKKKISILLMLIFSLWSATAMACTLFGASGSAVLGGGTIICKNRDNPPQNQKLALDTKGPYAFYGLYGDRDGSEKHYSVYAGVNEKGLAVISATAGSIPKDVLKAMRKTKGTIPKLLRNCASVDEAVSMKDTFLNPTFLMLSDGKEIALIEVGENGATHIYREANGKLNHTNHYLSPEFQYLNIKSNMTSSYVRKSRIETLMNGVIGPLSQYDFQEFSEDRHDGLSNSIWRLGKNKATSSQTLASFMVITLPDNDFIVRVKYREHPNEQGQEKLVTVTRGAIFGKTANK